MIRKLLRRILGPHTGDIYVAIDTGAPIVGAIVGVSTRQQGAELIRAEYAARQAAITVRPPSRTEGDQRQHIYDRTIIQNHELQDGDA